MDAIAENGSINLYSIVGNDVVCNNDILGLKWKILRDGGMFATAIPGADDDTFETLARELGLDFSDYTKWAHTNDTTPTKCKEYYISNVKVYHKGCRRFYENWPNSVIGRWDNADERRMAIDRSVGFQVISKSNIDNRDVRSDLALDGLYEYTFTGHGLGDGSIATEDLETDYYANRITRYGIHRLALQGCDTANDTSVGKNVRSEGWASNVATSGFFIGYMGKVNVFNESSQKVTRHGTNSKLTVIEGSN